MLSSHSSTSRVRRHLQIMLYKQVFFLPPSRILWICRLCNAVLSVQEWDSTCRPRPWIVRYSTSFWTNIQEFIKIFSFKKSVFKIHELPHQIYSVVSDYKTVEKQSLAFSGLNRLNFFTKQVKINLITCTQLGHDHFAKWYLEQKSSFSTSQVLLR